jgi:hypothetical protein
LFIADRIASPRVFGSLDRQPLALSRPILCNALHSMLTGFSGPSF